ncbi:MAG: hypothetical protein ACJAXT_001535 [Paracoccaceae bacterium]|jgi:hypothetical protein
MAQSSGMMVTYIYDLKMTVRQHGSFAIKKEIAAGRPMRALKNSGAEHLNGEFVS